MRLHPTDEDLSAGTPDLGLPSDARCPGWAAGFDHGFAAVPQVCAWGYRLMPAKRAGWWRLIAASPRPFLRSRGGL